MALVKSVNGEELALSFTIDGKEEGGYAGATDLFFATNKKEGWVNIYLDTENSSYVENCIYKSKEEAEESGKKWSRYITAVKIEWEE